MIERGQFRALIHFGALGEKIGQRHIPTYRYLKILTVKFPDLNHLYPTPSNSRTNIVVNSSLSLYPILSASKATLRSFLRTKNHEDSIAFIATTRNEKHITHDV